MARWGRPPGLRPQPQAELELSGEIADYARRIYCGKIGAEFMHIPEPEKRRWVAERLEADVMAPDRPHIMMRLIEAGVFEQVLQSRYPGTKRFSLEGVIALLPLLDEALDTAGQLGAEQIVLGMSHRGRLNVMVHIAGKSPMDIFARFEDIDPRRVLGGGDVKYHLGATGDYQTAHGRTLRIHLVSNPSHLEAVDPVALGRARAKQTRLGEEGQRRVLPILLHGDAAFAGQGTAAETLNLATLRGFSVGGTVHVIVNNLIGFTANPEDLYASRFASDVAKRLPIPIFHVNAEDPEAVVRVARLAVEYRYAFSSDVVVDLIGFRRYGHSEVDDPTVTQPVRYRRIAEIPLLWESYARKIGVDPAGTIQKIRAQYEGDLKKARAIRRIPMLRELPAYWDAYSGGAYDAAFEVDTRVAAEELREIGEALARHPEGFRYSPEAKTPSRSAAADGSWRASRGFRNGGGAGFWFALAQGNSGPLEWAGQPPRHFQPTPCVTFRHGNRSGIHTSVPRATRAGPL